MNSFLSFFALLCFHFLFSTILFYFLLFFPFAFLPVLLLYTRLTSVTTHTHSFSYMYNIILLFIIEWLWALGGEWTAQHSTARKKETNGTKNERKKKFHVMNRMIFTGVQFRDKLYFHVLKKITWNTYVIEED